MKISGVHDPSNSCRSSKFNDMLYARRGGPTKFVQFIIPGERGGGGDKVTQEVPPMERVCHS